MNKIFENIKSIKSSLLNAKVTIEKDEASRLESANNKRQQHNALNEIKDALHYVADNYVIDTSVSDRFGSALRKTQGQSKKDELFKTVMNNKSELAKKIVDSIRNGDKDNNYIDSLLELIKKTKSDKHHDLENLKNTINTTHSSSLESNLKIATDQQKSINTQTSSSSGNKTAKSSNSALDDSNEKKLNSKTKQTSSNIGTVIQQVEVNTESSNNSEKNPDSNNKNISSQMGQAKSVILETKERLQERGEKLENLGGRTENMANQASEFAKMAKQLKEKQKSRWF